MPRKGTPKNWKAAEYATALSGVVKTMQAKLLNGESVAAHHEEFLTDVVELAIALGWDHDMWNDLNHALGQTAVASPGRR